MDVCRTHRYESHHVHCYQWMYIRTIHIINGCSPKPDTAINAFSCKPNTAISRCSPKPDTAINGSSCKQSSSLVSSLSSSLFSLLRSALKSGVCSGKPAKRAGLYRIQWARLTIHDLQVRLRKCAKVYNSKYTTQIAKKCDAYKSKSPMNPVAQKQREAG